MTRKSKISIELGVIIFATITVATLLLLIHVMETNRHSQMYGAPTVDAKNKRVGPANVDVKSPGKSITDITPKPTPSPTPYTGFCLSVPILMYHHIQPIDDARKNGQTSLTVDVGFFDAQMKYLLDHGYHTTSVDELINALRGKHGMPAKSIILTMDDGYADVYNFAFPILKKYGLFANLFISTGLTGNPGYMTWDNIKDMQNSGRAVAYNHTWSHFALANGDEAKQESEIMTAKKQLEQQLGKPDTIFAYPYGSFTTSSVAILQRNNFSGALSTIPGWTQCDSFLYSLHRQRVGDSSMNQYGL